MAILHRFTKYLARCKYRRNRERIARLAQEWGVFYFESAGFFDDLQKDTATSERSIA